MTLFNVSLCLPVLDVAALIQKESIVVMTERFIVPNRSFALMPSQHMPTEAEGLTWYRPEVEKRMEGLSEGQLTHWATCTFSQQLLDESALSTIASRTIWTESALRQFSHHRSSLFLSLLNVYELSTHISMRTMSSIEQLYRFVPLTQYVESKTQKPLLTETEFSKAKSAFLAPKDDEKTRAQIPTSTTTDGETQIDREAQIDEGEKPVSDLTEDVLNASNWATRISEFGNSSDGHTFEKLVRKAFVELGFSNSTEKPEASIDPYSTGGAGGLDFYANQPYPIVGECKATTKQKLADRPATQLNNLGLKHLSTDEYGSSLKLLIVGGEIKRHENRIAVGHKMNVLRSETLQSLVTFHMKYGGAINLSELKSVLMKKPYGIDADSKIRTLIQRYEKKFEDRHYRMQQRLQIIQAVKDLTAQTVHENRKAFRTIEIRAHYNAKYLPHLTDQATEEILKELSSIAAGLLSNESFSEDQERFSFVKDMPIQS